jgi:hypothetical protein
MFQSNVLLPFSESKNKTSKKPEKAGGLLFIPEYGDDMFFQNTGLSPNYMAGMTILFIVSVMRISDSTLICYFSMLWDNSSKD